MRGEVARFGVEQTSCLFLANLLRGLGRCLYSVQFNDRIKVIQLLFLVGKLLCLGIDGFRRGSQLGRNVFIDGFLEARD